MLCAENMRTRLSPPFKRRLYRLELRRRLPPHEQISQETIEPIIEHELAGRKCNVGYRKMWKHNDKIWRFSKERDGSKMLVEIGSRRR